MGVAMRQDYTYIIEASEYDGIWQELERFEDRSAHTPEDYARALLESWIISYPDRLSGGERVTVYDGAGEAPPDNLVHVRVTVYRGAEAERDPEPAAVAYLEYDESEY